MELDMLKMDVIAALAFERDPEEPHSKVWKQLDGCVLEQALALPAPVLAVDSLLELPLDGTPRELRVDHVRWDHARQTLYLQLVPTAAVAAALKAQGLRAWRPWLRKRTAADFLARCRRTGWRLRGTAAVAGIAAPVIERIEPTL